MTAPLLFCGSSHPLLGSEISSLLGTRPAERILSRFPDGESCVEILDDVYRRDVFLLQTIALDPNAYLMELLLLIDALKRSSARTITAIIPYFGYGRQDRRERGGESISAKLVANMLTAAGADRLITCDLHTGQLEGFFEIPVDHVQCQRLLIEGFRPSGSLSTPLIVAPDIGSVKRAERMVRVLHSELVVIHKKRLPAGVEMRMIGGVEGREVVIVDDICSTGQTLLCAIDLCHRRGATKISVAVTHAMCSREKALLLEASRLDRLYTTNSIEAGERFDGLQKWTFLSIAPLIASRIARLSQSGTLQELI